MWLDYHSTEAEHGSAFSYRFDIATRTWSLVTLPSGAAAEMSTRHWYNGGTVDEFGNVIVLGHDQHPLGTCSANDEGIGTPCNPGQDRYEQFTFDSATNSYSWDTNAKLNSISKSLSSSTYDCPPNTVVRIRQYPRVHLLGSSGQIFYANGVYFRPPFHDDEWCYSLWDRELLQCSNSPRWTVRIDPASETHQEPRKAHSTVHYVWYDSFGNVHDSVYSIGGSNRESCAGSPADVAYSHVDRIVDPDGVVPWNNQSDPPDLNISRKFLNAVILLDGSIFAVGGLGAYDPATNDCPPVLTPEILEPYEVFGIHPTGWIGMNPHVRQRQEHSVAVLLPDGRVFVGGGKGTHSYWTYEVFEPTHHYKGRVPRVLSLPQSSWNPGQTVDFHTINVRCFDGAVPVRAALLRLGSTTHNFDTGQRYVALKLRTAPTLLPDGTWNIETYEPGNYRIAPLGVYWLTIVDDRGRPSEGRLITIVE